jgi:hypothetical protein
MNYNYNFSPFLFTSEEQVEIEPDLMKKFVIVQYDSKFYPGLVTDIDENDVQIKCMHKIGDNRFFWPHRDDVCWYAASEVKAVIPEPQKVTSRH